MMSSKDVKILQYKNNVEISRTFSTSSERILRTLNIECEKQYLIDHLFENGFVSKLVYYDNKIYNINTNVYYGFNNIEVYLDVSIEYLCTINDSDYKKLSNEQLDYYDTVVNTTIIQIIDGLIK